MRDILFFYLIFLIPTILFSQVNFYNPKVIDKSTGLKESVFANVLDGDGNMEVFTGLLNKIAWYGNFFNSTSIQNDRLDLLNDLQLQQKYRNLFNPLTTISYSILQARLVSLKIYTIRGQKIKTLVNRFQIDDYYNIDFDAKNLSGGVYFL